MRIDSQNEDELEAAYAAYAQPDPSEDSGESMAVVEAQSNQTQPDQKQPTQKQPTQKQPVEAAPVVQAEPAKPMCCICGVVVAAQQRLRDSAGRHWCVSCSQVSTGGKTEGMTPCPECGRDTRPMLMVDRNGERICPPCNENHISEAKLRRLHKEAVTAHPELEIRRNIWEMTKVLFWLAGIATVVTLYHFRVFYVHPKTWFPFQSALYFCCAMSIGVLIAIGAEYIRIAMRKRARRSEYDRNIQLATNQVLALDEDTNTMGINEAPEPLRRRVERAITRVEASGGLGMPDAHKIIESLYKHNEVTPLIQFLLAQRPNTADIVARNREIATISYLQVDLGTAISAATAILLRLPQDQDAMTRYALISFRNGKLEEAKKIFKRVINIAREKNSQVDLAAAFCNLGMLHVMLDEFDDASVRYSQAMVIYNKLNREDGQADCLLNLGLIAFRQKQWAEVETQLRKAMAINKRRNRREGLAICCSLLGVINLEKEVPKLKESKKLLNQAVRLNLELGRAGGVAAAYGNLGLVCVKREDFTGATELFLKSLNIYQRIKRPKMSAKIQGMLKTVGTLSAAKVARDR